MIFIQNHLSEQKKKKKHVVRCVLLATTTKIKKWINYCKALSRWRQTLVSLSSVTVSLPLRAELKSSAVPLRVSTLTSALRCCNHSDPSQQLHRDGHLPHCSLYCSLCYLWDWLLCCVGNKRPTWTSQVSSDYRGRNVAVTVSSLLLHMSIKRAVVD